jgi:hypothetical protein
VSTTTVTTGPPPSNDAALRDRIRELTNGDAAISAPALTRDTVLEILR